MTQKSLSHLAFDLISARAFHETRQKRERTGLSDEHKLFAQIFFNIACLQI